MWSPGPTERAELGQENGQARQVKSAGSESAGTRCRDRMVEGRSIRETGRQTDWKARFGHLLPCQDKVDHLEIIENTSQ